MKISWKCYTNLTTNLVDNLNKMRKSPEEHHFLKLTYNVKEKNIYSPVFT